MKLILSLHIILLHILTLYTNNEPDYHECCESILRFQDLPPQIGNFVNILQFLCLIFSCRSPYTTPHKLFALVLFIEVIYLSIPCCGHHRDYISAGSNISRELAQPRRVASTKTKTCAQDQPKQHWEISYCSDVSSIKLTSQGLLKLLWRTFGIFFFFSDRKINHIYPVNCQQSYLMLHVGNLLSSTILHSIFLALVTVQVI